jgi:GntR family transcriptional regulator
VTELPTIAIDRDSPVPLYFQLAELLENEITSGRWQPGDRIASEPELGEHYGLSRATIRQALARLEQEGLITRSKGRGTFVSSSRPRSWLVQTTEGFFHDEFIQIGHRVTSRVLRSERMTLPRWAADALALPLGSEGVVIERLRSVDQLVALYVINCLPASVADIALGLDPDESLYQRLGRHGVSILDGRRTIEAVIAGERLATLLEVEPTDALAYIESVSWSPEREPVDCYRVWLRTDRLRLDISVTAQRRDGLQLPDVVAASPR